MDLTRFLKKLEKNAGPVYLLMATGSSETPTQLLNLIVSAKKLDEIPRNAAIKQVVSFLRNQVSAEDLKAFARVTVLPSTDPFVQTFTSMFRFDDKEGPAYLRELNIGGFPIEYAAIYRSIPVNQSASTTK